MLRLRELREEIGKTQQEIAQIFQISRQVYANYENGINEPSMEMLVKFADFFDCTTDFLLSREDSDFGIISVQKEKSSDLSEEELALVKTYRRLNMKNRLHVSTYAEIRLEEQDNLQRKGS